ncbi:hypothetical protein K1T71_006426 [Dendrolimus kikuchii]|uniref:Uncharacterized protein n=1 Tax=Dendrolimus kikuchii TaxID=765133 RepID=A0ACC1D1V2_9NEOP|nr:hypothetical protein K1T71_006426 [Dendrolimus kikuchii]
MGKGQQRAYIGALFTTAMVMEASPSPQSVGREFVRQYYTLLNKAPAHLHRFYNNYSSFVHGGLDAPNRETLPVVGQKQIHNRIQQLNFRDCHAKISQVDAQATLGNGVVVQVTGELSNGGAPMRRFTQTFVLAAQSPKKYYVHNDIFRYQDIVFSDEEGEASGRSEGEEEEAGGGGAGGYFPAGSAAGAYPAGGAFPAPPQPPQAPHLPLVSPPAPLAPLAPTPLAAAPAVSAPTPPAAAAPAPLVAPPSHHLNGHPPHHEESTRQLVAALQVVMAPPEPKTYANLVKSGSGAGHVAASAAALGSRVSPPAPQPAPPAPPAPAAHAPPPQPHEQRPRHPRSQPQHQPGGEGGGRRYSDAQQLFLGNLPLSATEEELRALFARFGPVAELRVHSKAAAPGAPRHPNYGFITYESSQAALDCLNAAPLYFPPDSADGVKLNVEEKKARGREAPRRRPLSSHRAPPFPPRNNYRR